jgi:hypothetical protein
VYQLGDRADRLVDDDKARTRRTQHGRRNARGSLRVQAYRRFLPARNSGGLGLPARLGYGRPVFSWENARLGLVS